MRGGRRPGAGRKPPKAKNSVPETTGATNGVEPATINRVPPDRAEIGDTVWYWEPERIGGPLFPRAALVLGGDPPGNPTSNLTLRVFRPNGQQFIRSALSASLPLDQHWTWPTRRGGPTVAL